MSFRVLVTRPGEDGIILAEILAEQNVETIIAPLFTIKNIDGPTIELDKFQALLLTSANGVRALSRRTDRRDLPVYAVGDATAMTARTAGFGQVHSAAGNVETLVGLVEEILKPQDGPLLHISGSEAAGDLIRLIERAGFMCEREILYEASVERSLKSSTIAAIKDSQIDAVTLYSPRSAERLVELIRKARLVRTCQQVVAICLSQAVARKIEEVQWKDVIIAREPNQDSLLEIVSQLAGHPLKEKKSGQGITSTVSSKEPQPNKDPVHKLAPNRPYRAGTFRTVVITLLVVAVLIGASLASKPLWQPKFQMLKSTLFQNSETSVKITDLSGRLEALEKNQQIPDLDQLQQERARLQAKLDKTLNRVDTLESSISSMKKIVDAVNIETRGDGKESLRQLFDRIKKLENENSNYRSIYQSEDGKTLKMLAEEVAALEKKLPDSAGKNRNGDARALVLSIGQLREAVRAGQSFESELTTLKALVGSNPNIKSTIGDTLSQMDKFAKVGAPNLSKLQSDFAQKAGKIVQAGLVPADGSWIQRTFARLVESVRWRRTDNFVGNGVEAVVARAEWAIKSRDVVKAVKELSILNGKPKKLAMEWLYGARTYIVVEKALAQLQTRVVAQIIDGQ